MAKFHRDHAFKDRNCRVTQGHDMRRAHFHHARRAGPCAGVQVNLPPCGLAHFTGSRRRENREQHGHAACTSLFGELIGNKGRNCREGNGSEVSAPPCLASPPRNSRASGRASVRQPCALAKASTCMTHADFLRRLGLLFHIAASAAMIFSRPDGIDAHLFQLGATCSCSDTFKALVSLQTSRMPTLHAP